MCVLAAEATQSSRTLRATTNAKLTSFTIANYLATPRSLDGYRGDYRSKIHKLLVGCDLIVIGKDETEARPAKTLGLQGRNTDVSTLDGRILDA
jgi:hypothetical protein